MGRGCGLFPALQLLRNRVPQSRISLQENNPSIELAPYLQAVIPPAPEPPSACANGNWQPWVEAEARLQQLTANLDSLADKLRQVAAGLRLWQPLRESDPRVERICAQLDTLKARQKSLEIDLRVKRALLLAQMGRNLEARADHLKVLELDHSHHENLVGLGCLLTASGYRTAAKTVYRKALEHYPEDLVARVNLGALLLDEDPAAARVQYQAALQIDPEFLQAHGGLYYALARLGQSEASEKHRRRCFGRQSIFEMPYRGQAQPIPVLLFVSSRGGNTPIERFLDNRIFATKILVTDFFDPTSALPEHSLLINGIGDVDVAGQELAAAQSLLARTSAPVVNPPAAVRATSRGEVARRLSAIASVITPRTDTLSRQSLAATDAETTLAGRGFEFPVLLRTPGFHGGQNFLRVEEPADLRGALAALPGRDLTVIQYLDGRGHDGKTRKYRVMMIDGELFPLHAAISSDWKVHYFSAEMSEYPEHRAEDAEFLSNMDGVLGSRAMTALAQIQQTMGLDYGGIDFGLTENGEVLLFEANTTMVVLLPDAGPRWNYRKPAVDRIFHATWKMLINRAKTSAQQDKQAGLLAGLA